MQLLYAFVLSIERVSEAICTANHGLLCPFTKLRLCPDTAIETMALRTKEWHSLMTTRRKCWHMKR